MEPLALNAESWMTVGLLLVLLGLVIVLTIWVFLLSNRLRKLETAHQESQQRLAMFTDTSQNVGRKLVGAEVRLKNVELKLRGLEASDLEQVSYNEAARLLAMGADMEDIMDSCGLSRAEAELIFALHSGRKESSRKK